MTTSSNPQQSQNVLPVKASLVGLAAVMAYALAMLVQLHHAPAGHAPSTAQHAGVTHLRAR